MQSITMSIIKAIKFYEEEIDKIIEGYVSISITKKNPNIITLHKTDKIKK